MKLPHFLPDKLVFSADAAKTLTRGYDLHKRILETKPSDLQEQEFDIGDSHLAVGADLDFPEIKDPCDFSPTGEHVYAGPGGEHCRWCRGKSGLDR